VSDLSAELASLRIQRDADPGRPRRGRALVYLAVVLAALSLVWFLVVPALQARVFKTEVLVTQITMVSPAQASVTLTSTGYVVPQVRSKVGAKVTGRLLRVRVREGDKVKAGDIVAELDAADQRALIASAGSRAKASQARVETARANLAEVQKQVERNRALVASGALAPATLEDLESRRESLAEQVKAAEAETRASEAEIGPMRVGMSDRVIVAPIAGTVLTKPPQTGELVGPETTVVEIADFDSIMVETDVPEARLYQVKPGTPCEIVLDAYPGKRYRGEAVEIGKRIDRAKATVMVRVKFVDAMDGVLPEMSARTSFLSQALSEAAAREAPKRVLPSAALAVRDGQNVVFALDEDIVRRVPVRIGGAFGGGFELLDGPLPGTRVVASPPASLAEGQHIKEKGS
jgi:RND family efflux transporter MFP subunit